MLGTLQVLVRALLRLMFRVKTQGWEHYPSGDERLLIVANHVSFLDGLLLSVFLPNIPIFVINTRMARHWWIRPFISITRHIAIDPTSPLYLKELIQHLKRGERVAIFPEGRLTVTGGLMKIYEGPALAADKAKALILPIHIEGAQYSLFSRLRGKVRRRLFPPIRLTMLPPRRFDLPSDLSGRERRQQLGRLLDALMTELVYAGTPIDRSLIEALLEARRIHGGSRIIVEDIRRQPLSYRRLFIQSFVLSGLLARNSAGQRRVGILLPNAVAAMVAFLALHLRGQVPVLLNFTLGVQDLLAGCRTAKVSTVYTSRTFVETARLEDAVFHLEQELRVIFLEDLRDHISPVAKLKGLIYGLFPGWGYQRLAGPVNSEDAAVVLFTSGSEGRPKGVVLSHRNLLANRAQVGAMLDIGPMDKVLNVLPLFHAFGLSTGTLVPLLSGIKTFLYPSPLHYHIIPELAYELGATIMFGTNTFLMGYGRSADPYDFFNARLVVAGAEPLRNQTRQLWMDKFGIRLIEGYGVTEAGPVLAANSSKHCRAGSVGQLVPGIEYYLESVEGITQGGRLCVRGPNIMAGYLLTERPGGLLPPRTDRGEGWYDTGDIVSLDKEGFVTIHGRAKRFAKIGGEMVSLASVEHLASTLWPQEQHAAVNLPDPVKGERIILLTTHDGAARQDLVKGVHSLGMGEIFVPREIRIINELPLLGSGKLDYGAIRRLAEEFI